MKHELKCWPEFFQAAWCGDKTFEVRKNDRNFKERDEIVLQEWDNVTGEYTEREIEGFITYLYTLSEPVSPGYVVFSFRESHRREE